MFILRIIDGQGLESNTIIGNGYNVIYRQDNPQAYDQACRDIFSSWKDPEEAVKEYNEIAYALISYNEGAQFRFLYPKQQNYIMTSDGKTFKNLTLKV